MVCSFDVFDTCLVRKCGAPENMFDVLSFEVFTKKVEEFERQEFVARRKAAQSSLWNRYDYSLEDIYDVFEFNHPAIRNKKELVQLELQCEEKMLLPVVQMLNLITVLRQKGKRIVFISDMYLPHAFILSALKKYGFFQEGDRLFVSNQVGCLKLTGELYRLIQKEEGFSFSHWEHWGDNRKSDYEVPRKLGIRSHCVVQSHAPYPKQWIRQSHSLGADYAGMVAGLSKALRCSMDENILRDFDLDIVAPLYCAFVCRILSDAVKRHVKRLYFCARDAFWLFKIAEKMKLFFPLIEVKYLFISKTALYDGDEFAKMKYFEQEGLASREDDVAVVDVRSSGHTLYSINEMLAKNHYKPVRGYYFELFTDRKVLYDLDNYYCEMNSAYHYNDIRVSSMMGCWHLYESLFSLNNQQRTIGYEVKDEVAYPVFSEEIGSTEECWMENKEILCDYHAFLLRKYIESYIDLKLMNYSDKVMEEVAIPTLISFFRFPEKHYLSPLKHFYAFHWDKQQYVPYVKQESWLSLLKTKARDSMWRKGTVVASLPSTIVYLLYKIFK